MTQNNNGHNYGSRTQNRDWNESPNQDRNDRRSNRGRDYDEDQHAAQGVSPRWNRTSGYNDDNFSNGRQGDYDQRSGNRYDGNYAGREYGSGNYSSDWNQRRDRDDRNPNYGNRESSFRDDRGYQDYRRSTELPHDRSYENASRNMYGNDYSQGQYGSHIGRNYGQDSYNEGRGYGQDNNSYGRGTNYGVGTNYGAHTNYGSGNWGSGANNNQGNWNSNNDNSMGGQHRGKGPKGYNRSDDRIKEDISDRLSDDGQLDASEIELEVANGVVSLSGTVDSREAKRRAEDIAESISGVSNVENRLSVNREGSNDSSGTNGSERKTASTTSTHATNGHHDSKNKRTLSGSHN